MKDSFPIWEISAEQQRGLLIVACVLAVLSLAYASYAARKERDPFPLFVFLGAGFAVLLEPVGDIFTQVVYPQLHQVTLFSAWGRLMPIWMGPNYLFFFCVPVLWILRNLAIAEVSTRKWWLSYFVLVVAVAAFEMPGIAALSWKYYGEIRPLTINSYPLWVGFNNAQCLFSTAVGVRLLRSVGVRGRLSVSMVALVPLIIAGTHIAPSVPIATATHSGDGSAIVQGAAAVTIALNILMVWVGLRVVRATGHMR